MKPLGSMLLLCVFTGSLAVAQEFTRSPLDPGVWRYRKSEGVGTGDGSTPGLRAIPGFRNPGAVIRHGNLLYVGNDDTDSVAVVDVATAGQEAIVATIVPPLDPIDLAIVRDRLYVIDQDRDELWHMPLAGGSWQLIPLPNGTITEWEYGNILFPHPTEHKLFVTHFWENQIDVVNLDTRAVETTITDLHHLPNRIIFTEDATRMVVLGVGLSAPSCLANGPNIAVFDLATLVKLYEIDVQGDCSLTLVYRAGLIYDVRNNDVLVHRVSDGSFVEQFLFGPGFGRHAVGNGREIIAQSNEDLLVLDYQLTSIEDTVPTLQNPQIWYPPLEEMVAMPPCDGRVFATNRNDDTLSILELPTAFNSYGTGCAGTGGTTPGLSGSPCPTRGTTVTLAVSGGPSGAPGCLVLGLGVGSLALGPACTFHVEPFLLPIFNIQLDGNGTATQPLPIPGILPAGLIVTFQSLIVDPGASNGFFSATNGLRASIE